MLKKKEMSFIKLYIAAFKIFLEKGKKELSLVSLYGLFQGITLFLSTIFIEAFFDRATQLYNGEIEYLPVILSAAFLLGSFWLNIYLNTLVNTYGIHVINIATSHFMNKVNKKSAKIEVIKYEDSKTLDDINKAQFGCEGAVVMIFLSFFILTAYISYFCFMGKYLFDLSPILTIAVPIVFVPAFVNQYIRTKIFTKLEDESANVRRETDYYEKCLVDREYFKETRILGAFNFFNKKYSASLDELNQKKWKAQKKASIKDILANVMTTLGYAAILALMFVSVVQERISIAAFGAVLASLGTMFSTAEELIGQQVAEITRSIGPVRNLINFLNIEEDTRKDVEINMPPSIDVENVSFSYPESDKLILNDVSISIKSGETIAIVGENGSGKTTFMRILLGLYKPTQGDVFISGNNTKEVSTRSLLQNSSAVFQKFNRYKLDLSDNITISDIDNKSEERVRKVIDEANIDITKDKFNEGIKTNLSKEFGGIDLSGGEWQRVAIARGLYKSSNLIILDEPTAAIDPLEEGRIFTRFKEVSKGKTSIIVTHRMGTVKIADRIVVLDKGEIKQVGTHEELINRDGMYKEMYLAQSKWYERGEEIATTLA